MSVNKVILIGRTGKDAEVRTVGESKVATFSLATSERYKDSKTGEYKENTEWHNIVCWRATADLAEKYIKKGMNLYIEGKLRTRTWDDQNGVKKSITEIVADSVQLLDKKQDSQLTPAPQERAPLYQQETPQRFNSTPLPVDESNPTDDLPFS